MRSIHLPTPTNRLAFCGRTRVSAQHVSTYMKPGSTRGSTPTSLNYLDFPDPLPIVVGWTGCKNIFAHNQHRFELYAHNNCVATTYDQTVPTQIVSPDEYIHSSSWLEPLHYLTEGL